MKQSLELFYFPQCPFCALVLDTIEDLGIEDKITLLNIRENESYFKRLLEDTKRTTVPCLYIDNKPMFESNDIVNWLRSNLK